MPDKSSSLVFLQYLTVVFDNIKDAILLIGVEPKGTYRLLVANKVFFAVSGFPEDSVGKEVSEIVGPEGYAFLKGQYEKVAESKQPLDYIRWSDVPAGRRAFEVQMIPVLNTVGECVQIVAITRDITEHANLKKEVEQLRKQQPFNLAPVK